MNDLSRNKIRDGFDNSHKLIQYSQDIAFQVLLLSVLNSVRGVPLNLFDNIMNAIFVLCKGNLDFNTVYFNSTRNGLLTRLKKINGMTQFKASMVSVTRSDGATIGVVVFDTVEVVMNMLEDPRIEWDANIAQGYNFWYGTYSKSDVYGEFHTGDM